MRSPAGPLEQAAAAALPLLPPDRREMFDVALRRWWPDLRDGLSAVYPDEQADTLALRLATLAARAAAERPAELVRLDLDRLLRPDWFQDPAMIGYATYADRFAADLAGVAERIDYLSELGVSYLHLMPLLRPRPGDSDGGYAVADYRQVAENLGSMNDLRALATRLRRSGISLVLDLVLNHVAAEHEWARRARAGEQHYRDYFYLFGDRELPDAYEATLPEVFPATAPGNFTFDQATGSWVWTTFNSWQWDVNWTNPDIFHEYADIILFLANTGVQVLRLDAIAFVYKRLGTDCQNQPEVHAITQALRAVVRIAAPAVCFKAEAIVGPAELVQYFGQGRRHGKVSDIAYHNSLMVQIWSMLAARDVALAARALAQLPVAPSTTAWVTYLRCHDDIGWAIDDADAAAVGLSGPGHRQFLSDYYSGAFPGSPARGLIFQYNPANGDARISGMAASLAGAENAVAAADADRIALVVGRLFLAHAIILGWGGIPVLWMGDELGLTNDPDWAAEPGHGHDNRWTHRPRMDWDRAGRRQDADTFTGQVFRAIRTLVTARVGLDQLHASIPAAIGTVVDPGVLPVIRRHPVGVLLGLYNVTDTYRPYPIAELTQLGLAAGIVRISGDAVTGGGDGQLWLPPYSARWITATD